MGNSVFILGFADELVKLAQMGPRPAPGTRMPPKMTHMPAGPKKFAPPKKKGPMAEGIVPGTFQGRLPNLPSGKKMPRAGGIVSAVGERKKWEAANKPKLPGWLSDSMKRSVKGNPMASAEGAARAKREDAAAKKMVSEFVPQKKPKTKRGGRGFAAKDYGPSREDLWRMAPGRTVARTAKGGGTTGPTGIMRLHRPNLRRIPPQRSVAQRAAPPWKPQGMTVPGYKAVAKKRTI